MPFYILDREHVNAKLSTDFNNYPSGIVIPLDKPYKWTSADAVRKIKFMLQNFFKIRNIKVGHAGTLDPLATGMLLICVGNATKKAEKLQQEEKEYLAEITFGCTTPSFDKEKEIDAYFPYEHIDKQLIEKSLRKFIGEQDQIPPLFSAKLVDGKRAYEIARSGNSMELKPSKITISELNIVSYEKPLLVLQIRCSKGTYIRSLARDLGYSLESGAYLSGLVRTSTGIFNLRNSVKIEEIESLLKQI